MSTTQRVVIRQKNKNIIPGMTKATAIVIEDDDDVVETTQEQEDDVSTITMGSYMNHEHDDFSLFGTKYDEAMADVYETPIKRSMWQQVAMDLAEEGRAVDESWNQVSYCYGQADESNNLLVSDSKVLSIIRKDKHRRTKDSWLEEVQAVKRVRDDLAMLQHHYCGVEQYLEEIGRLEYF